MAYALNGSNGHELVHPPVNDSAHEVPDMVNYPYIRFFRAGELLADHPTAELAPASQGGEGRPPVVQWSKPCPTGEASSCRVDFSNMCWFFGRNVQAALAQRAADAIDGEIRPIGLIGTYVGGTADELWSSKDALRKCLDPNKPIPTKDSQLWNGMVNPILNTTIKGAIWYQGEADAGHPGSYVGSLGRWLVGWLVRSFVQVTPTLLQERAMRRCCCFGGRTCCGFQWRGHSCFRSRCRVSLRAYTCASRLAIRRDGTHGLLFSRPRQAWWP